MSKINQTKTFEIWKEFDFESIKTELDSKVIEIAQQLEEGDQSRKKLIEQTKDFRRGLNEDQRKLVAPILKSFQVEVDSSSKRSKLMEQVLLKLYKSIIDLPDPVPALESVQRLTKKCERVSDLEIENKQLRETLDEYNNEFKEVKNQEVTIKMLKDKIKDLEEKSEVYLQQRIKEREKEMQKNFSDKEELSKTVQFDLVKKLGETEAKCLSLQAQLQKANNDLYELKSKQDELINAKSCEIDLLMLDLDKMNERAANAERLAEQLSKKSSEYNSAELDKKADLNEQLKTGSFEVELAAKEKEISQLVDDIQKLQIKANKARELHESQRAQLEERLNSRERTVEELENQLRKKSDYDDLKRELGILKMIEFNLSTENTESVSPGAPATDPNEQQAQKPIEILLLEKNRFLQNENMQVRNKLADLQTKHEAVLNENSNLSRMNVEQKGLIVELEKDLLKLAKNQKKTSESDLPDNIEQELIESIPNSGAQQQQTEDMSLFNIVSNQRERFRQRVQELESENLSSKQQISFLTNEIDRLRSDNVKLYEKIKFLKTFSGESSHDSNTNNVMSKYTNDYESNLDPFAKFARSERQKRYTDLKLHDKFTLSFGRFILSSKLARLIFCGYIFVIHLLIFLSLYHMAHHDASYRDFSHECSNSYRDHMHKVHGDSHFTPPK